METLHKKISSLPVYGEWIPVSKETPNVLESVLVYKNSKV